MPWPIRVMGPGRIADERNDAGASVATAMVGEDSMGPRSDRVGGGPPRRCAPLAESPIARRPAGRSAGAGSPPDGNMSAVSPSVVEDAGRAGRRMVRRVTRFDPLARVPRRPRPAGAPPTIAVVGWFGHGNYGDELF